MPDENTPEGPKTFIEVLAEEKELILKRRSELSKSEPSNAEDLSSSGVDCLPNLDSAGFPAEMRSEAWAQILSELKDSEQEKLWEIYAGEDGGNRGVVGLALSGGGIRSSTFNLGIIQALHKCRIFGCIDYLSTVSGGGYIGSTLSSIFASSDRQVAFPFMHAQNQEEGPVFRHLRNNSKFLAPDGFLDYLRIPAVLLRGAILNLLTVLSAVLLFASAAGWFLGEFEVWEKPLYLTVAASTFFIILVFLYPPMAAYHYWRVKRSEEMVNKKPNDDDSKGGAWNIRNKYERFISWVLCLVLCFYVLELQPYAIFIVKSCMNGNYDVEAWIAAVAGGSGLLSVFSDVLMRRIKSLWSQLALWIVGALAIIAVWLTSLYLSARAIEGTMICGVLLPIWYLIFGLSLGVYLIVFLDINKTSMHNFYRDRLSKAFLVKITTKKSENNIKNGSEISDDDRINLNDTLKLSELDWKRSPFHLINVAINTRRTEEAYQKGRKAGFFTFSKLHVGSDWTGYCDTTVLERLNSHINLGTAMAISGAAAAPNMGRSTNPLFAVLLAMLNIRLNYWMLNPKYVGSKAGWFFRRILVNGPVFLYREILGKLTDESRMVNLSDGGHIDNSGVYPLLKRNCRLIVFGDGEHDDQFQFEALSEVIRMAQIDLGIKIEMDGLDEVREGEQSFAVGTVHYKNGRIGKLLYLKLSLSGDYNLESTLKDEAYLSSPLRNDNRLYDRSVYMMHYKAKNPAFPHQSTGDQFFSEQQFECYRALGYAVGMEALAK